MKKTIIALMILGTMMLVGCKSESVNPQCMPDWDYINENSEDCHVYYVVGESCAYTDGSWESNLIFDNWKSEHFR